MTTIFDEPAPTVFTATCPGCQQPRRRHLGAGYFMPTGGGCACPEPDQDTVTEVSLAGCSFSIAADGAITAYFGLLGAQQTTEVYDPFTGAWGRFLAAAGSCPTAVLAAVKLEKETAHA